MFFLEIRDNCLQKAGQLLHMSKKKSCCVFAYPEGKFVFSRRKNLLPRVVAKIESSETIRACEANRRKQVLTR